MKVFEQFGTNKLDGFKIGIEFEIEGIAGWDNEWLTTNSIHITEDQSLRNYGGQAYEFITKPVTKEQAIKIHDALYNNKKVVSYKGEPASDRCSIHVHVNFSDVETEKARSFILLYALLEPLFFEMVDDTRQNNIYCVPLSFTALNKWYPYENLPKLVDVWSKYTAFNIMPLGKQGSIEFRHLQGTKDNKLFTNWVEVIERLYKYNLNKTLDPQVSQSFVMDAAYSVFGNILPLTGVLKKLENTILDIKLALLDPDLEVVASRIKAANLTTEA